MNCRQTDLDALGSALQHYRDGHSALVKWIEETTERQENAQPGQTDSKALSEQLAQQTVCDTDSTDLNLRIDGLSGLVHFELILTIIVLH